MGATTMREDKGAGDPGTALEGRDVVEVFSQREGAGPRRDVGPVVRTMLYTLNISARFLGSALLGRGSIARGDELLLWWAKKIFGSGNGALYAQGRANLEPGKPYVFMSNHNSLLDIPAAIAAAPSSVRMVMKQELLRVPVWGRAMVSSGFIPVDRTNRQKAIEQLEAAKEKLAQGVGIWVFAEGTRSRTGEVGAFKKGGFHVARQLGLPIVPVWISGTREQIPPDTFKVRYHGQANVRFGRPISTLTPGGVEKELDALMSEVREAMLALAPGASHEPDGIHAEAEEPQYATSSSPDQLVNSPITPRPAAATTVDANAT